MSSHLDHHLYVLFFRENNHVDQEEDNEKEEEVDINLEDKSDFEKQQILVNIILLPLSH